MSEDYLAQIRKLSAEGRKRAESFLNEAQYYGWKLESIQTRPLGNLVQCTLNFDLQRIVFLCRSGGNDNAQSQPL